MHALNFTWVLFAGLDFRRSRQVRMRPLKSCSIKGVWRGGVEFIVGVCMPSEYRKYSVVFSSRGGAVMCVATILGLTGGAGTQVQGR